MRVTSKHPTWEGLVPRVTRSFISFVTWTGPFGPRREGGGAWVTIVHGSLGSFVTSFHRYHSSLGPFFLTVFDRRAHLATLGSVDDKGRRNRAPPPSFVPFSFRSFHSSFLLTQSTPTEGSEGAEGGGVEQETRVTGGSFTHYAPFGAEEWGDRTEVSEWRGSHDRRTHTIQSSSLPVWLTAHPSSRFSWWSEPHAFGRSESSEGARITPSTGRLSPQCFGSLRPVPAGRREYNKGFPLLYTLHLLFVFWWLRLDHAIPVLFYLLEVPP